MEYLMSWFKKKICKHKFNTNDLQLTNIPKLEKPKDGDYRDWQKYFKEIYEHESVTKRVEWPCCECGQVFYAHCGLDVLKHGKIVQV